MIKIDKSNVREKDVSKLLYGIFYEDIGFSADGGMSAQLVQNGNFEHAYIYREEVEGKKFSCIKKDTFKAWVKDDRKGDVVVKKEDSLNTKNPLHISINVKTSGYKLRNKGYYPEGRPNMPGMGIFKGEKYEFSFFAKNISYTGSIKVYLVDIKGDAITDELVFNATDTNWTKYEGTLKANRKQDGQLILEFIGEGEVKIDFVSLYPVNVWKKDDKYISSFKFRQDLMQSLYDLEPKFMRFPGGCIVEGEVCWANSYLWKNTIGDKKERIGTPNLWHYYQSYEIGFFDYFTICDEIGAYAVPMINAGLLCQGRHNTEVPLIDAENDKDLFKQEVVDSAAHLIYFAKGSVDSSDPVEKYWAGKRAEYGRDKAFKMIHLGIGNENWGAGYERNFNAVKAALKEYDGRNLLDEFNITLIIANGFSSNGQSEGIWKFVYANDKQHKDIIVDEHFYKKPEWMMGTGSFFYDNYDRDCAKIFISEYATHVCDKNDRKLLYANNLKAAIGEAAFMIGCERNSDIIDMISYAPLFAKYNSNSNGAYPSAWWPNLIWFDNFKTVLTPSYYTQKMFTTMVGNKYINTSLNDAYEKTKFFLSATYDTEKSVIYIKIANDYTEDKEISFNFNGFNGLSKTAKVINLTHKYVKAINTLTKSNVVPQEKKAKLSDNTLDIKIDGSCVTVIEIPFNK